MTANTDLLQARFDGVPVEAEPVSLSGGEWIGRPYRYELFLRSGTALIDPDKLLSTRAVITIATDKEHERYVTGLVRSLAQEPADNARWWNYRVVIEPRFAFLAEASDCRFFENKSAKDIASLILGEFGIRDVAWRSAEPPARPYTVMFNETYLAFVERILAAEGLFYFFEFSDKGETLVIGDSNSAFHRIAHPEVDFGTQGGVLSGMDSWHRLDAVAAGRIEAGDYNPEISTTSISGSVSTLLRTPDSERRPNYVWPADAAASGAASASVKRRMEAVEARSRLYRGAATNPELRAGGKFSLKSAPEGGEPEYIACETGMSVTDTARTGGGRSTITVTVTAFPTATPWRPVVLPKPVMAGLYTATVIGPQGEEIHNDKLGRIKVRFPWDHRKETTDSGSFWLRVVQPWAGAGWGAQFIPRVGQEVAVTFLEGDIDRPVAVGALYNSANTPIFPMDQKNKSGFRSRSTKNGGAADYNEFSFDDTKGSETVLLHAQKDHVIEVEHDQTMTIGNCRTVTVKKDEKITIDGAQAVTVAKTQTVKVTQDVLHQSMQSITLKVGESSIKIDNAGIT
ncbi:MAG TPA: type VI secretion system tip protein TssI/VgrG, partial [Acetobacteraceae bacterium]|nr:type VI secretion system tip protein TssI/VgrG [Acetobacteraceae bacterium]